MKKTYEEKITGEIRRTLRHLEEACDEQGITIEQALEWWDEFTGNKRQVKVENKEKDNKVYRERVEDFVAAHVSGVDREICIEILCFLHEQEKCPSAEQIVEMLNSKLLYIHGKKCLTKDARNVVQSFLRSVEDKEISYTTYRITRNWASLKNRMFILAKSL